MSTKQERIEVFEDTQYWISHNAELSASVVKAKKGQNSSMKMSILSLMLPE